MLIGCAVGAAGFYFHVHAAASRLLSLKGFVYAAPVVAPLLFVVVASLGFLALFMHPTEDRWHYE